MSASEPQTAAEGAARDALQSAIEGLYSAFAAYPLRPHVEGCTCCVSAEDEACLNSKPLQALTADDLSTYAFRAMTIWGDEADFRHFLPRLFELLAFGELVIDPEVLVGKLEYAGWRSWPGAEQSAVETYLSALWRYVLVHCPSTGPCGWTAAACLCSIAQAVSDPQLFLNDWQQNHGVTAGLHLAQFLARGGLENSFWKQHQPQRRQVCDWIKTPAAIQMLDHAWDQAPELSAHVLLDAVDQLGKLQRCSE